MNKKELRSLKRTELLELLLAQSREIEQLRTRLQAAEAELADRRVALSKAGSIAEASLALTTIFEQAQKAVDTYMHSVTNGALGVADLHLGQASQTWQEVGRPEQRAAADAVDAGGWEPAGYDHTAQGIANAASAATHARLDNTQGTWQLAGQQAAPAASRPVSPQTTADLAAAAMASLGSVPPHATFPGAATGVTSASPRLREVEPAARQQPDQAAYRHTPQHKEQPARQRSPRQQEAFARAVEAMGFSSGGFVQASSLLRDDDDLCEPAPSTAFSRAAADPAATDAPADDGR